MTHKGEAMPPLIEPEHEQAIGRVSAKTIGKVALLGMALAPVAHAGGVLATNLAPAHVETANYTADVSLSYSGFDTVVVPSAFGNVNFGFDSVVPTPAIVATPKLNPQIIDSYAKNGVNGLSVSEAQIATSLESLVAQLGERYATGAALAMLLAYGAYTAGSRRWNAKAGAAGLMAVGLAMGYQAGSAATTYQKDTYKTYAIDGLAGSLRLDGEAVIGGIAKRTEQIQPYVTAWAALRNDLAKAITSPEKAATGQGPKFMLVSDIHNINMMTTVQQIVDEEKVDAVIDSGDLLVAGHVEEAEYTGLLASIAKLSVPYLIVLGNHDKSSRYDETLIKRLMEIPNVVVLQQSTDRFEVAHFGDLTVAGANDSRRWYGDDNKHNAEKQKPVVEAFNKTFVNRPPDIAVSHEPAASKELVRRGVAIAGHMHKASVNGTLIVNGTLTGGGIFGYNDSTDSNEQSPEQSYGILNFDEQCHPNQLVVSRFDGMVVGNSVLKGVEFYFFDKPAAEKDAEPVGDCSDTTFRREIVTTPRDTTR